ncbi:MAG: tetratricopeptide repeat protein [Ignavibacteria bacterium]|nr:tetratricopeptide repeat protein [Ignavibacteria bacterium]
MRYKEIVLILLASLIFQNCTSTVQTRYNIKLPKVQKSEESNIDTAGNYTIIDQTKPNEKILPPLREGNKRNFDTLEIELSNKGDFPKEISRGNELFEAGDYKSALQIFLAFINRANIRDFYFWYARFRAAECLYEMKQISASIQDLTELYHNENVDKEIKEKTLLKLGKIYCEQKEVEKANFYFELLRKEFPSSTVLPIPNCNQ